MQMSHFKTKMHKKRFVASVRLSVRGSLTLYVKVSIYIPSVKAPVCAWLVQREHLMFF